MVTMAAIKTGVYMTSVGGHRGIRVRGVKDAKGSSKVRTGARPGRTRVPGVAVFAEIADLVTNRGSASEGNCHRPQNKLFDHIWDIQRLYQGETELLYRFTGNTKGCKQRHTETGPWGNGIDPFAQHGKFPTNVSNESWRGVDGVQGLI